MLVGVVLAGGAGRRLGGADKPALRVGGRALLDRALDALAAATSHTERGPVVVVGPVRPTSHPVVPARESPPGAGPAAALAAGLAALPPLPDSTEVALLAADLANVTAATIVRLRAALAAPDRPDGALLRDETGHLQWLLGVWRLGALRGALPAEPAGAPLREMLGALTLAEVAELPGESADVDTPEDLARARALTEGEGRPDGGPSQPSHW